MCSLTILPKSALEKYSTNWSGSIWTAHPLIKDMILPFDDFLVFEIIVRRKRIARERVLHGTIELSEEVVDSFFFPHHRHYPLINNTNVFVLFIKRFLNFLLTATGAHVVSLAEMGTKYRGPIVLFAVIVGAWTSGSCNGQSIDVDDLPEPVDGLSWTFYNTTCPDLESIVKSTLDTFLDDDITQAAGLLRLHFHDCFVQGCDASVLLNITDSSSERQQPPNLTLRDMAFTIIDAIKAAVEANCSGVVSCADILTLAARDSVAKSGGPEYPVPLGRRDSTDFANSSTVLASLPNFLSDVDTLVTAFAAQGLNVTDLVSLSGGHTIGLGHCTSFQNRLYNTTGEKELDPTLNQTFADSLYLVCPALNVTNTTNLDVQTPDEFDLDYYLNIQNGQVLFTSDQTLYGNSTTQAIVDSFASNQTLFFQNFVLGMFKMGQIQVLTGTEGEIRTNCSVATTTSANADQGIRSVVDPAEELPSSFHSV